MLLTPRSYKSWDGRKHELNETKHQFIHFDVEKKHVPILKESELCSMAPRNPHPWGPLVRRSCCDYLFNHFEATIFFVSSVKPSPHGDDTILPPSR